MGRLEFTEEVTDLDERQRRWIEVTRTGDIRGIRRQAARDWHSEQAELKRILEASSGT